MTGETLTSTDLAYLLKNKSLRLQNLAERVRASEKAMAHRKITTTAENTEKGS